MNRYFHKEVAYTEYNFQSNNKQMFLYWYNAKNTFLVIQNPNLNSPYKFYLRICNIMENVWKRGPKLRTKLHAAVRTETFSICSQDCGRVFFPLAKLLLFSGRPKGFTKKFKYNTPILSTFLSRKEV